jgi:sugar phosphate isomerase/epimerase
VWTETFGDGDMDYRPIAAYLKGSGYSGYLMVELAYEKDTQVTRPLEEDLRISRDYAQKMFGV